MPLLKLNLPPVEMNLGQFEDFIELRGVRVAWEKAAMCPCVRADATSGRPSFNCGDCYNGNRYIDRREIKAAATNVIGQRNAQVFGDLAVGGVYITVSGLHRLGINDRITMLDQTARYAELCELPTVRTKAVAVAGATTLTLEHTRKIPVPKLGVARVAVEGQEIHYTGRTVNALTGIPASGPGSIAAEIPANAQVQPLEYSLRYAPLMLYDARTEDGELVAGEDFEVVDERRIRFYPGRAQSRFSVLYESRPVYLVDQLTHEYRDQLLKAGYPQGTLGRFPVAAVLRKDFLNRVG
jgi:hypothetical protein